MLNKNHWISLLKILWPIKKEDLASFIPMSGMMLCFLANFSALRSLKDSLVVPALGPEVISFLKIWFVFPAGILFTLVYVKLSNSFNIKQIFVLLISLFSAFFILFGFVLYPNMNSYSIDVSGFISIFPYAKKLSLLISFWPLTLIYIFGDLWSSVMINLMFWQFANITVSREKAIRFYPTFGVVGNLGLIITGSFLNVISDIDYESNDYFIFGTSEFNFIRFICLFVSMLNLISMIFMNLVVRKLSYDTKKQNESGDQDKSGSYNLLIKSPGVNFKSKTKLSFSESLKLIFQTKILFYLAMSIICYNTLVTITEGPWKEQVNILYPSCKEYLGFMGKFNIVLGISAILFVIIGNFLLQNFPWIYAALFSPIIIVISGTLFFSFIIFSNNFIFLSPVLAGVIIGSIQNIVSKSTKYSIFDASKEMVYIPLSLELQSKGKAAVEIIGGKLGKMCGSFLQVIIFSIYPDLHFVDINKYLFIIFVFISVVWFINIYKLDKELSQIKT